MLDAGYISVRKQQPGRATGRAATSLGEMTSMGRITGNLCSACNVGHKPKVHRMQRRFRCKGGSLDLERLSTVCACPAHQVLPRSASPDYRRVEVENVTRCSDHECEHTASVPTTVETQVAVANIAECGRSAEVVSPLSNLLSLPVEYTSGQGGLLEHRGNHLLTLAELSVLICPRGMQCRGLPSIMLQNKQGDLQGKYKPTRKRHRRPQPAGLSAPSWPRWPPWPWPFSPPRALSIRRSILRSNWFGKVKPLTFSSSSFRLASSSAAFFAASSSAFLLFGVAVPERPAFLAARAAFSSSFMRLMRGSSLDAKVRQLDDRALTNSR